MKLNAAKTVFGCPDAFVVDYTAFQGGRIKKSAVYLNFVKFARRSLAGMAVVPWGGSVSPQIARAGGGASRGAVNCSPLRHVLQNVKEQVSQRRAAGNFKFFTPSKQS
jgi:hypothetical protein